VVVLGERRLCALLLAVAGILACLVLVLTPSSGAQAQAVARSEGAVAATGEDCVEFEDEADEQTTEENEETVTEQTGEREVELESAQNENNATDQLSQLDNTGEATGNGADIDVGTQSQDAESGDIQQSLETGSEGDGDDSLRSEQPENEDDGDGTSSLQDEENGEAAFDDTDDNEDTTSGDAEDNDGEEEEECVIAESVPDELLPPTGVSAKPQNDGPAQRKESDRQNKQTTRGESSSDRNEKTSDRDAEQKKTVSDGSGSTKRPEPRSQQEKNSGSAKKSQSKKKVEIKDRPSGETVEVEDRSSREPSQGSLGDRSKAANTPDPAPRLAANWSSPSRQEVASASKLRRFAPNPAGSEMTLSVRALGLYDAPVASSGRPEDLDNGLVRMPQTDLPWGEGEAKNVYVAGHYLGLEGTNSRMVFYNLHKLKKGDEIALKDGLGRAYRYRVSEKFAAGPEASWAMGDVRDRDMLTLQTCIPPDFGKRLLVRADRVRDDR
jgi:LPXTG-site transpeptidase (sortase) family protein